MRFLRGVLALVLSYALGVQPAVAQVATIRAHAPASVIGAEAAASAARYSAGTIGLQTFALIPSAQLSSALLAPAFNGNPSIAAPPSAIPETRRAYYLLPGHAPAFASPVSWAEPHARVFQIQVVADKAVEGLSRAAGVDAREKADRQFAALTDELPASSGAAEVSAAGISDGVSSRALLAKSGAVAAPKTPKPGFFQVFLEPERNKAFWRYVTGYAACLFGFGMYMVSQPYLVSSMTTNALNERHDPRAGDPTAVAELIRTNRSLASIAHWAAEFFSFAVIPLFGRRAERDGPGKWLGHSTLIRGAVFAAVPVVFFATGILGLQASLWLLLGVIAAHSFFQGVSSTADGKATALLLGDKSVTSDERTRANSILSLVASVVGLLSPAIAGQIAGLGPVHGRTGAGAAAISAIYAGAIALAGLIYSGIKLWRGSSGGAGASSAGPRKSLGGTLKELWTSIKDGTRIVLKDRLLRMMLLLSTVTSLFSGPFVSNVLPEYVGHLVAGSGAFSAILGVPGLGWFLSSLIATPMGSFALMMVAASVGSIVAALLIKPLNRLFAKLGFKTDEARTIPFYFLAALQAPIFLLMMHTTVLLVVAALYGLQALVTGFFGIATMGLYQKNLGGQKPENVNKILVANSLIGIGAAIVSTFVYGVLLNHIAIGTSMILAAVATCVMAALLIAAPFLAFTKAQRRPPSPAPAN